MILLSTFCKIYSIKFYTTQHLYPSHVKHHSQHLLDLLNTQTTHNLARMLLTETEKNIIVQQSPDHWFVLWQNKCEIGNFVTFLSQFLWSSYKSKSKTKNSNILQRKWLKDQNNVRMEKVSKTSLLCRLMVIREVSLKKKIKLWLWNKFDDDDATHISDDVEAAEPGVWSHSVHQDEQDILPWQTRARLSHLTRSPLPALLLSQSCQPIRD